MRKATVLEVKVSVMRSKWRGKKYVWHLCTEGNLVPSNDAVAQSGT